MNASFLFHFLSNISATFTLQPHQHQCIHLIIAHVALHCLIHFNDNQAIAHQRDRSIHVLHSLCLGYIACYSQLQVQVSTVSFLNVVISSAAL